MLKVKSNVDAKGSAILEISIIGGSRDMTPPRPRHPRSSLRSIPLSGYVFFAVFLLRLIVLVRLTESPFLLPAQGDMHFYNEWAQRILRGEFSDHRAFYGLPLYPYLLAGFYKVFGFSPFLPGLLQAVLEGGTAAVLFKIADRIFANRDDRAWPERGKAIGLLAAAGWAFFLPAQSYSVIMMPTAWLVFVFWWLVWQIVRRTSAPGRWTFLLFGLLIGFVAMGIATIFFLLPLFVAALFLRWNDESPYKRNSIAAIALLFLGVGLGTSPAWLHNRFVAHDPFFSPPIAA